MLGIPWDELGETHLATLETNRQREGKHYDFKFGLPSRDYDGAKDFLADVSSFANAAGGHLLYGAREEEGELAELSGLDPISADDVILWMENLLRDCIDPRIPGVQIKPITLATGRAVLLIRIPRSFAQPHVVKYRKHWRFYSRHSAGKYALEVEEVRNAFLLSETRVEQIRRFRADRLSKIMDGETPIRLEDSARLVLHVVPFGAFEPAQRVDVTSLSRDFRKHAPIGYALARGFRYNLDGIVFHAYPSSSEPDNSYLQVFRSGSTEAVDTRMLLKAPDGSKLMVNRKVEKALIDALARAFSIQRRLAVESPLMAFISLLGVRDYIVGYGRPVDIRTNLCSPIDRDSLILPDVMVRSFDELPSTVLRPLFDMICNASGLEESPNYDHNGNWIA